MRGVVSKRLRRIAESETTGSDDRRYGYIHRQVNRLRFKGKRKRQSVQKVMVVMPDTTRARYLALKKTRATGLSSNQPKYGKGMLAGRARLERKQKARAARKEEREHRFRARLAGALARGDWTRSELRAAARRGMIE